MPADNMARLIAQADLMVCSAGSVSWERCCLGKPALMISTATNQANNLDSLTRKRTGISLGAPSRVAAHTLAALLQRLQDRMRLLRRMGRRAGLLVDGHGARRVASHMLRDHVQLRPARLADAELVWPWRNAPVTRRHFFDPRPVLLAAHMAWWEAALVNSKRSLLIATIGDDAIGVLRLDQTADSSLVSIYIDPRLSGLRLGERILAAGQAWINSKRPDNATLRAEIMAANSASIHSFEAVGFVKTNDVWIWHGLVKDRSW
jgi:RimJ/RimL family protein N-acetyltransferase